MAKSSTRRVTIFINGKEVEASVKQIRAEMNRLVNEQNRMVIGSDEYIAHAKKIKELRGYLKQHAQDIGSAASAWSEMYNKVMQFGTGVGGLTQILSSLDNITSTLKQVATDLAAMDDVYSDVIKTTGLTREEVEELNESFKNLDTRTSREQLNNLAYIAGKLGISSKEMVQQFVEAADIINVSMGDVLGDDATLAIGKMVDVYKKSTDMLKDKNLKEQLLSLGSAVNELGKTSTANEQYMVNFTGRLGGIAVQAGLAADQILGFASALDQDMQKVEMSATAFQKLIQKVISKPAEFAKVAGMGVKEFTNLIENDMNEALKKVLAGFSGAGGFDKLLPIFQDLGLDGARAAAEEPDRAYGVVGRAEGPRGDEHPAALLAPRNGVDLRDLERLLDAHRREDRRNAPRDHRLAGPRRANHQKVVTARDGDLDRRAQGLLSLHVREVVAVPLVGRHERSEVGRVRHDLNLAAQVFHRLAECSDGDDVDARDDARLLGVLRGDEHGATADAPHLDDDGDDASDAPHVPCERQLPDERVFVELLGAEALRRLEERDGDGEVVDRALLADVGGREVHRHRVFVLGAEARVPERGGDAVLRLLDRLVGEADDGKRARGLGRADLDLDSRRVDAVERT